MSARRGAQRSWRRSGRGEERAGPRTRRAGLVPRFGSVRRPRADGTGPDQLRPPLAARRAGQGRARRPRASCQRRGGRDPALGAAAQLRPAVPDTNTTKTELRCLAAAMAAGMEPPNHIMVTAGLRSRDSRRAHAPLPPFCCADPSSRACAGGPSPAF